MKTTNDIQKEALAAQQEGAWPMVRNLLVLGKPLWLLR